MSDTKNVKLGVCRITWGGVDLGYTKGGVEVEIASETKKVMVDQFGNSEINEYIMGRTCKVRAPLAETTVENLQRIMPGSTMTASGGVAATGSFAFAAQPAANDTITVNGLTFTFVAAASALRDIEIGATLGDTLVNAVSVLEGSVETLVSVADYTVSGSSILVTHKEQGIVSNTFTIAASSANIVASGATLTGGIEAKKKAEVTNGIGVSLLDSAKELVLHPVAKPDSDRSDDFIVPLASTAGQASFAYKLDEERIFNVEFTGYPNPQSKILFIVGDPAA